MGDRAFEAVVELGRGLKLGKERSTDSGSRRIAQRRGV